MRRRKSADARVHRFDLLPVRDDARSTTSSRIRAKANDPARACVANSPFGVRLGGLVLGCTAGFILYMMYSAPERARTRPAEYRTEVVN